MNHRYMKSLKKTFRRIQNWVFRGHRVLVLGDSHCGAFEYCFDKGLLAHHWLNCEIVGGATAYGLNNDSSATGAWRKFEHSLGRYASFDVVLVMLGECDCSFALWKKAKSLGVPPETLIDRSLLGIRRLVQKVRSEQRLRSRKIILVGAILPTINDQCALSQGNEMRRTVNVPQLERTRLVLHFNERQRLLAHDLGVDYIDITQQTLNVETGLVDSCFVASENDHHLSNPATASFWAQELLNRL